MDPGQSRQDHTDPSGSRGVSWGVSRSAHGRERKVRLCCARLLRAPPDGRTLWAAPVLSPHLAQTVLSSTSCPAAPGGSHCTPTHVRDVLAGQRHVPCSLRQARGTRTPGGLCPVLPKAPPSLHHESTWGSTVRVHRGRARLGAWGFSNLGQVPHGVSGLQRSEVA